MICSTICSTISSPAAKTAAKTTAKTTAKTNRGTVVKMKARSRTGWSFVELLCVISVLAVIGGPVVTFLSTANQFQRMTRQQLRFQSNLRRLAEQFCADVRLCQSATNEDSGVLLSFGHGRTITYLATDVGIERIERKKVPFDEATNVDAPAGQTVARDRYWLPWESDTTWQLDPRIASISVTPPKAIGKRVVIDAHLSGDLPPWRTP